MISNFEQYVKETVIPQMKEAEMVKMTVTDADGNRALISKDKHGYFKVTFTFTKQYN